MGKRKQTKSNVPSWIQLTEKKISSEALVVQNGELPATPEWKPFLDQYRNLLLLRFPDRKQLYAAVDLLWTEPFLNLPHDSPDGKTLILPMEALPYFAQAGIKFVAEKALSISDLTEEEIEQVRRS